MVDKGLGIGNFESVERLRVTNGTERGDAQRLGLTALEEAGAMGAGQHANLGGQRADLRRAASVGTFALMQDFVAHVLLDGGLHRVNDMRLAVLFA